MGARAQNAAADGRRARLEALLRGELDFHRQPGAGASHAFHAFPARFPPQLARHFIDGLTAPGDVVLDPMAGSGTTVVEAFLAGRQALGFDIDPLACLQSRVKTTALPPDKTLRQGYAILERARDALSQDPAGLSARLAARFDPASRRFVDYWFAAATQLELQALLEQIERLPCPDTRAFMLLAFSATIITKSGGVSLALDLAHTRPHRAKRVTGAGGQLLLDTGHAELSEKRARFLTKTLKSPLDEFRRRLETNARGLAQLPAAHPPPRLEEADAQALPLAEDSVDLIVTSPPYAANAIDYMRAHKFALVWLGHAIEALGARRRTYIGSDAAAGFAFEQLPPATQKVIASLAALDAKKARALRRYYSEMTRALREMQRVLCPGAAAIVVVGSSVLRGMDVRTPHCLAEIGRSLGFELPHIGRRRLERDRRMMPAAAQRDSRSQIQRRMHEEYVIGFCKPASAARTNGHRGTARRRNIRALTPDIAI